MIISFQFPLCISDRGLRSAPPAQLLEQCDPVDRWPRQVDLPAWPAQLLPDRPGWVVLLRAEACARRKDRKNSASGRGRQVWSSNGILPKSENHCLAQIIWSKICNVYPLFQIKLQPQIYITVIAAYNSCSSEAVKLIKTNKQLTQGSSAKIETWQNNADPGPTPSQAGQCASCSQLCFAMGQFLAELTGKKKTFAYLADGMGLVSHLLLLNMWVLLYICMLLSWFFYHINPTSWLEFLITSGYTSGQSHCHCKRSKPSWLYISHSFSYIQFLCHDPMTQKR